MRANPDQSLNQIIRNTWSRDPKLCKGELAYTVSHSHVLLTYSRLYCMKSAATNVSVFYLVCDNILILMFGSPVARYEQAQHYGLILITDRAADMVLKRVQDLCK